MLLHILWAFQITSCLDHYITQDTNSLTNLNRPRLHLFPEHRTSSINSKQSLQYSASCGARLKHQWETDMYLSSQWEIDMCVAALVAGFPAVFTQLGADLQVHGSDSRHSGSGIWDGTNDSRTQHQHAISTRALSQTISSKTNWYENART